MYKIFQILTLILNKYLFHLFKRWNYKAFKSNGDSLDSTFTSINFNLFLLVNISRIKKSNNWMSRFLWCIGLSFRRNFRTRSLLYKYFKKIPNHCESSIELFCEKNRKYRITDFFWYVFVTPRGGVVNFVKWAK